jgi:hypothetical protein
MIAMSSCLSVLTKLATHKIELIEYSNWRVISHWSFQGSGRKAEETHKFGYQLGRSCLSCELHDRNKEASNGYQPLMDSLWTLDLSFVSGMVRSIQRTEQRRDVEQRRGCRNIRCLHLEGRRGDRSTIHRPAILFSPQSTSALRQIVSVLHSLFLLTVSARRQANPSLLPCHCRIPDARMSAVSPMAERGAESSDREPRLGWLLVPV